MNPYDQIATKIVREQELVIGPLAWSEAGKVAGLHVGATHDVSIDNGNGDKVIDALVGQYEHLFGRASREVCRDAAKGLLSSLQPAQIPSSLRAA